MLKISFLYGGILLLVILSGCSVNKRRYTGGWQIEFRKATFNQNIASKRKLPDKVSCLNSANVDLSKSAMSIFNSQKSDLNNTEESLDYALEQSYSHETKSLDDTTSPTKIDSVAGAEQAIASAINLGNKYDKASNGFPLLFAAFYISICLFLLAILGYILNPVVSAEIFVSYTGLAVLAVVFIEILLLFKLNYLKNKQNEWCKLALALAPKSRIIEYEVRVLLIKSARYSINKNLKEIEKIRDKYQTDPSNPWMKKLDVLEAQIRSRKSARYNK